jgi:HlyD family secretion protein
MTKRKKNNKYLIWILLVVIVLLIVAAVIQRNRKPKGEEVEIAKVERKTIKEMVSASGKIFPEKEVKISSDVSGEIVELLVEEGDSVRMGQLLAKIDPEAYESAVERGVAGLNNMYSNLAIAESNIESSVAQKEQILAQYDNALKIHNRNTKLIQDGVISEQDFEQSLSNLQQLEANLKAAEANFRSANKNADASSYSVQSAKASLKELQTSLNRTTIASPTNGIISKLNVEQGERVVGTMQMTGTEMMRIANFNSMEVQVEVSENDILRVALGDTAEIEVDAYFERKFSGVVTEIASSAANTGQNVSLTSDQVTNFIVKIRILPDSYADLMNSANQIPFRPGMSASVDINTETLEDVISVPIQAVTTREPEKEEGEEEKREEEEELLEVVFLFESDSARMVQVVSGIQDNEYIQIMEGLEEGQTIVKGPYSAVSRKLENGSQLREKEKKKDDEKDEDSD